jgi:ribosomal protein S18 acetylase RimI-like enzyme
VSQVVIRTARPDDLPVLDAVEASANRAFDGLGLKAPEIPAPPQQAHWAGALNAGTLWVADDASNGVIGFLAAEVVGDGLHIAELDVAFERQQQGHGRRLVQTAIDFARARRLAAAMLTTQRSIAFNGPFYASMGFAELASTEAPAWLAAILAAEIGRGLEDRCAMRLVL